MMRDFRLLVIVMAVAFVVRRRAGCADLAYGAYSEASTIRRSERRRCGSRRTKHDWPP